MKTFATVVAGAVLALSGAPAAAETLAEKGEAKLARLIDGRVAGEPVSCISAPRSNKLQVIEYVGVVYDAGDTVYVSRPSDPRQLGRNDAVIIDRFSSSQLCNVDVRRTFDRNQGNFTGVVFLGDFVPYRKG